MGDFPANHVWLPEGLCTHIYRYYIYMYSCNTCFQFDMSPENMGCGKGSSYCSERVLGVDSMLTFSSRISSIRRNPRDPTVTTFLVSHHSNWSHWCFKVGWPEAIDWNGLKCYDDPEWAFKTPACWWLVRGLCHPKKRGGIISPFLSRTKGWHIGSWTLLNWNTMLQNDCDMREPSEWIIWGLLFGFKQPRTNIWIVTHLIAHIYYPYHIQKHHFGSV